MRWILGMACLCALVGGCQTKPPPDPNDPAEVGLMQPDVLMKNLKWASDAANMRVLKGEMTDAQAKDVVSKYAADLTRHIELKYIRQDQAWEYAEVFRTARIWDRARIVLEFALKNPNNEDRRVNDTLRLAQVLGYLDDVGEAILRVESVLDTPPQERAPLMPALTLEIIPACKGKGMDKQLADLLEKTIPIYEGTVVDPNTVAGSDFLIAKPYHIRRARKQVEMLRTGKGIDPPAANPYKEPIR